MKEAIAIAAAAGFVVFAWLALPKPPGPQSALPAGGGHADHAGDPSERSQGVVLSMDRTAKRVVISHGSLKALGMPPMTMEFNVADELPEQLKAGDSVRFHADAAGGVFTASRIEIAY